MNSDELISHIISSAPEMPELSSEEVAGLRAYLSVTKVKTPLQAVQRAKKYGDPDAMAEVERWEQRKADVEWLRQVLVYNDEIQTAPEGQADEPGQERKALPEDLARRFVCHPERSSVMFDGSPVMFRRKREKVSREKWPHQPFSLLFHLCKQGGTCFKTEAYQQVFGVRDVKPDFNPDLRRVKLQVQQALELAMNPASIQMDDQQHGQMWLIERE